MFSKQSPVCSSRSAVPKSRGIPWLSPRRHQELQHNIRTLNVSLTILMCLPVNTCEVRRLKRFTPEDLVIRFLMTEDITSYSLSYILQIISQRPEAQKLILGKEKRGRKRRQKLGNCWSVVGIGMITTPSYLNHIVLEINNQYVKSITHVKAVSNTVTVYI